MACAFVVLALVFLAATSATALPSVEEYFPQLGGDLTLLEWAHAVNNQNLLKKALDNETIMMLEADVVMGKLNGRGDRIPIMGHPPVLLSDLSLEQFVDSVIHFQSSGKKGIKLDFKSDEAFTESSKILANLTETFTFPVWLNADILPGPDQATTVPLDSKTFLENSHQLLPETVLSVGWTTKFTTGATYTEEQISKMLQAIKDASVKQPVTLAVRAAFTALSEDKLIHLVNAIDSFQGSNKTTLTVWMSSDTDVVDTTLLRAVILKLGKNRVALDVPEKIRDALDLDKGTSGKSPVTVAQGVLVAVLSSVSAAFNKIVKLFYVSIYVSPKSLRNILVIVSSIHGKVL